MIPLNELIIHAARKGEIPVLQELVSMEADVNTQDEKGYTPLIIACYNEQYEAAKFLLENGADVNAAEDMKWFLSHKFQFITTNEPEMLLDMVKAKP